MRDRLVLARARPGATSSPQAAALAGSTVPVDTYVVVAMDDLEPRARLVQAYGNELPVACLDDLVRSHGAASRAKDRLTLARLIDLRLS